MTKKDREMGNSNEIHRALPLWSKTLLWFYYNQISGSLETSGNNKIRLLKRSTKVTKKLEK